MCARLPHFKLKRTNPKGCFLAPKSSVRRQVEILINTRSYSLYYIEGGATSYSISATSWVLGTPILGNFRPKFDSHWDPASFGGFWWTSQTILGATEERTGAALWCHDWTRYGKDMSECHVTWQDMAWVVLHDEMRHDVVWGSHTVTGPRDPASSQV